MSEEELLLRYDECNSNIYFSNYNDPSGGSYDRDVPHEYTRRKKTQKYLSKSYHRIKCTAATFLAIFMWKRPLNNIALTITTHKKLKRVSGGTGTQVRDQIINKCRIKMVRKELYNVRDLP